MIQRSFRNYVQEWTNTWLNKQVEGEWDLAYEFAEEAVTSFPFESEEFESSNNKEIDDFYKAMIPLIKKIIPDYEPSNL